MTTHPGLGYVDEGVDLQDPAVYRPSRARFGEARILTPVAFRSKSFADLEDEQIWTRSWICIGSHLDIPNIGDLLPYTVGNHAVHVQRGEEALIGRFNLAQHGGCRFVPAQCQTGTKTRCSFTSCGYSRDRDVIAAGELGDNTPAMRQYLGFRPDRLLPVKVDSWGPLLFVNLDHDAGTLADHLDRIPDALALETAAGWTGAEQFWVEYPGNWKLLAHALTRRLSSGSSPRAKGGGTRAVIVRVRSESLAGAPATLCWLFPNLIVLRTDDRVVSVVLQPTSLTDTLARVRITAAAPVDSACANAWRGALDEAGRDAGERQNELERFGTPSRPETSLNDLPSEEDRSAYLFQKYLIARVLKKQEYHWNNPLYSNVMR